MCLVPPSNLKFMGNVDVARGGDGGGGWQCWHVVVVLSHTLTPGQSRSAVAAPQVEK